MHRARLGRQSMAACCCSCMAKHFAARSSRSGGPMVTLPQRSHGTRELTGGRPFSECQPSSFGVPCGPLQGSMFFCSRDISHCAHVELRRIPADMVCWVEAEISRNNMKQCKYLGTQIIIEYHRINLICPLWSCGNIL